MKSSRQPGGKEKGKRMAARSVSYLVASLALVVGAPVAGTGAPLLASVTAAAPATAKCTGVVAGVAVYSGSAQVTLVGTAFAEPLEAEVVDTGGCPVAGVDVAFVGPGTGAFGLFPGGAIAVTVPTNSDGIATAPTLTANEVSGSFSVSASYGDFSADFTLTNTTVGVASSLTATSGSQQSATVGDTFGAPLQVTVTDAYGSPVIGTEVDFDVVAANSASATFEGGGATATAETNEDGVATSPLLIAGETSGAFSVTASLSGLTSMATFALTDLPGAPSSLVAGVGASQSTELGADFPVPLAVTVTDSYGNPVVGATVDFAAPVAGASGVFAGTGSSAEVLTNSDGVATAPDFSANERTGGYVVTASVKGVAQPATFALVNEPRTSASAPGVDGSYWLVTSTGRVLSSGDMASYGSLAGKKLAAHVVGMAAAAGEHGYWIATSKGTVYAFGDAVSYGSVPHPSAPVVGIAATPAGKGYWLVSSNGAVYAFGDAVSYGEASTLHLVKPVVGIAATPDGKGYWLVASDGGIFAYGDARFYGSAGNIRLVKPIVGISAAQGGKGYWLVASDGGIFAFGQATFYGAGTGLSPEPVTAVVTTPDGAGYWVVSSNGTAAGFGDAGAQGSATLSEGTVVGGAA